MTQQKYHDDQFLRKAFDTVYKFDTDTVKKQINVEVNHIKKMDKRILGMSMTVIAIAVLIIVVLNVLQVAINHAAWQNRPTFQERFSAPYGLEAKFPPLLDNAVAVDAEVDKFVTFQSANIEIYTGSDAPQAADMLSQIVKMQSILPQQIDTFTLQHSRVQKQLLPQCLFSTGVKERTVCDVTHKAEFLESGNFVDENGNQIHIVMTKFADATQATTILDETFSFARSIGHIGNFALLDLLVVDYFYSTTRHTASFTWSNENWVFNVSSNDFATIDAFMEVFPLYTT